MIQDFFRQLKDIPRALMLAGLLMLGFLYISENGEKTKEKIYAFFRQRWKVLFVFYLAFILTETIFSRQITVPYGKILKSFAFFGDAEWDKEIIENILIFVPYSFLYLQAFDKPCPWKSALLLSSMTTVFIEISQLLFWLGAFQFADMIHNIIGGIIGYILWITIKTVKKVYQEKYGIKH